MKLQDPRWLVVLLLLAAAAWPASAGEPALELLPPFLQARLRPGPAVLPLEDWERPRKHSATAAGSGHAGGLELEKEALWQCTDLPAGRLTF